MTSAAPLYGLILSGGRSTRMGQDKGALVYGDQPEVLRLRDLLLPFCREVFLSCRQDQAEDPAYVTCPQIHDQHARIGPMGGLLSAMAQEPKTAWLVVACDMPRLDAALVDFLVQHHAPDRMATCFENADHTLEPLCAIYEPSIYPLLQTFCTQGDYSLNRVLRQADILRLACPAPGGLLNVNTEAERRELMHGA